MLEPIYLDYAATTPVDTRVAKAMMQCLTKDGNFGNPASRSHSLGWRAEEAVENARRHVADLIHADPREIVWTSGATESNNLAIKGILEKNQAKGKHIITSQIEHKAVLDTCQYMVSQGYKATYLQPDSEGLISPEQVADSLQEETVLVSLMHVNNEIGVINDLNSIGKICRDKSVFFHVDAAQSAGKLDIDVVQDNIDLLSISAHKMYGPKGIGALYVRRHPDVKLVAQIHGGGHERGMRSGTLATHQIVGLGEAARIASQEKDADIQRIKNLADTFITQITKVEGMGLNGSRDCRYPGIVNIHFGGFDGETLLMTLRELAISSGSACTSASVEPSYVIKALGVSNALADASLRFSFGRYTTENEVQKAIEIVTKVIGK
ncbi:IscS subfamily cysteine desulfurase [Teredinibacter sp. KSP-S5-2]|uniref:IscS subfamily cysteine desulfurase n=1 Tax=Teredinibacter sp. KSP-S5-2 TaxID=3034506 RepID=UPI0029349351|nr:IscS subfamily cysteine desulfurase [Teredinibacter sp. KSP-S5-2]WNO11198.1 IscS subfamily cysteine desulfurase [Teredinibacter sp. KSP-S5-2]